MKGMYAPDRSCKYRVLQKYSPKLIDYVYIILKPGQTDLSFVFVIALDMRLHNCVKH